MNKKIENIELTYENCESIVIKGNDLIYFEAFKAFQTINSSGVINHCSNVIIKIKPDFTRSLTEQKGLYSKETSLEEMILERNDITSIEIKYIDSDESLSVCILWKDDNSMYNDYQVGFKDEDGNFFIIIDDNSSLHFSEITNYLKTKITK